MLAGASASAAKLMSPRELWHTVDGAFGDANEMWPAWISIDLTECDDGVTYAATQGAQQMGLPELRISAQTSEAMPLLDRTRALIRAAMLEGGWPLTDESLAAMGLRLAANDPASYQVDLELEV